MPNNSPYIINGKPTVLPSFCVYMDILGFSDLTIEANKNNQVQELFDRLHRAIVENPQISKHSPETDIIRSTWQFKIFTDNVILGQIIYRGSDAEGEFGHTIEEVAYYQMSLALDGFFVRGGFTIGPLYVGEDMVYGISLLEAYNIEKRIAQNPRIVISPQVMELVKKHLKYYGHPQGAPQNSDILVDTDNQPFVNYLITLIDEEYHIFYDELYKHKENIENCLVKFKDQPHILLKYIWLANYHNYFCKIVNESPNYNDKLLIDPKLAIQQPRRLVD